MCHSKNKTYKTVKNKEPLKKKTKTDFYFIPIGLFMIKM